MCAAPSAGDKTLTVLIDTACDAYFGDEATSPRASGPAAGA
jgi:hypothetical protein